MITRITMGIFVIVLFHGNRVYGQNSHDSIQLNVITIEGEKTKSEKSNYKVQSIDSASIGQNLEDQLKYGSSLFLRSSGIAGEVFARSKGLQSRHTKVFWNDINVSTLGTGLADLSIYGNTLQNQLVVSDRILDQTLYQDILSSAIYIDQKNIDKNLFALELIQSSFRKWQLNHFQNILHNRWASTFGVNYERAMNNYKYTNYLKFPNVEERQSHAEFHKVVVQSDHQINLEDKNASFALNTMFVIKDREIPATLVTKNNDIDQKDIQFRINAIWKKYYQRSVYSIQFASISSWLDYDDRTLGLDFNNVSNSNTLRQNFTYNINPQWKFLASLDYKLLFVNSNSFDKSIVENAISEFCSIQGRLFDNQLKVNALLRHRFQQNLRNYFSTQMDFTYSPKYAKVILLLAIYAYGNELPTVNERFWQPGGNPDLKAETAHKAQMGVDLQIGQFEKFNMHLQNSFYLINMKDMILWLPTNKSYWQPINITKVWNIGTEQQLRLSHNWTSSEINSRFIYNYTDSRDRSAENVDQKLQMIYLPKHTFTGQHSYTWNKALTATLSYQYVSDRFVTQDNLYHLNAYWLLNSSLAYVWKMKRVESRFLFGVNNLTNNQYYQETAHIPMPGINYEIGIRLQYE